MSKTTGSARQLLIASAFAIGIWLAGCGAGDTPSTPTSAPQPVAENTAALSASPTLEPTSTPTGFIQSTKLRCNSREAPDTNSLMTDRLQVIGI